MNQKKTSVYFFEIKRYERNRRGDYMAKNPVIEKAKQDGHNKGFAAGMKLGFEQGKYNACMFFADRFDGLDKVKGIGPKTMKIVVEHFGAEYFKAVEEENEKQAKAEKKVEKVAESPEESH